MAAHEALTKELKRKSERAMKAYAKYIHGKYILAALLMPAAAAFAEGNCPPGYYPIGGGQAGWHGCAPMNGGIDNESPREPHDEPQRTEEVWEDRWGAIATANGAMGQAVSKKTRREAEEAALADCRSRAGAQPCKLKPAYFNQCIALAWGDELNVAARGPDLRETESRSVAICSQSTKNCKIYYSACSLPVRIR